MTETQISTFMKLVEGRRSIRRFSPQPLERESLQLCLEAARLAPSAENAQPWRFLVIDDPQVKKRFSDEAFSGIYKVSAFAASAPVFRRDHVTIVIRSCRIRVPLRWGP